MYRQFGLVLWKVCVTPSHTSLFFNISKTGAIRSGKKAADDMRNYLSPEPLEYNDIKKAVIDIDSQRVLASRSGSRAATASGSRGTQDRGVSEECTETVGDAGGL